MAQISFYDKLATMIASVRAGHPVRVAVDGVDAAGKTTLANALAQPLSQLEHEVIRASIDGFHRPKRLRYMCGKDSPAGYYYDSFDYEAVILYLLKPLGPAGDRIYRTSVFDHITDTELNGDAKTASDNAILIFVGVFLLRPELNPFWDFRIFVNVSIEIAKERAIRRDSGWMGGEAEAMRRYETRYYPGQLIYIEQCDPMSLADVVVVNDDPLAPTASIIVSADKTDSDR